MQITEHLQEETLPHQRIGAWLRERILSGELAPGTRLPSMHQLAREWETSYFTIHSALTPLVREGLLERRRKFGTMVRGHTPKLTCVGIYYGMDVWATRTTVFYQTLHAALKRILGERGLELDLLIDSRLPGQQSDPLPELAQIVEGRKIQALIVPLASAEEKNWLQKLPIPLVYNGTTRFPNNVHFDTHEGLRLALQRLRDRGVRKIGLISSFPKQPVAAAIPPDGKHAYTEFYENFTEMAAELGMITRDEWCKIPPKDLGVDEIEEFGYHAFQEIWSRPKNQRPDGLLCKSDVLCRGVVMAVLEKQAHSDGALKLVLEKNEEVGFLCPIPADWIVTCVTEVAEGLITQIRRQVDNIPVAPIVIPVRLQINT